MKAIVLCAGLGTRLRPVTHTLAKHLIPVANKPVLFYGLESLVACGIREIGIIVSPTTRAAVAAAIGTGEPFGARVSYIEQSVARGLAHAANCAREFIGCQPFLMHLGDTLLPAGFHAMVEIFRSRPSNAVVQLAPVAEPSHFGVAELVDDRIVRLVEKPQRPASNFAVAGAYLFDHHIFEAIDGLAPSWRNEYEITDAIQALVDRGLIVRSCMVNGWWKDTGKPADILEANRVLLERIDSILDGTVDAATRIVGTVSIGSGAQIVNSRITGPAVIGRDARIARATVGPFASVGDRVELRDATVTDSIIMEGSVITAPGVRVEQSLLGRNVRVYGATARATLRVILGDDCEVELS